MELQKLQRIVVDALDDMKGQDIKVYNTVGLSDMFDRVVLASGTSNRQTRSLAWSVAEKVKAAGGKVVSVEGTDSGEWVLVDLGDIVVHIMQPAIRQYYKLEEMWGARPVRLKLDGEGAAVRRIVAHAEGAGEAAAANAKKPARKPAAGARAPKKSAPKKTTAKQAGPKKSAAAKTAAKKPAKSAAARTKSGKTAAKKRAAGTGAKGAAKKPAKARPTR